MTVAMRARTAADNVPRTVPGLKLWLEARRPGATLADGAAVATWYDLSGLGNNVVQATAAKKPLYRSQSRNLLTYNQATVETNTTGLAAIANCAIARSTAKAAHGVASLAVTASAANAAAGVASFAVTAGTTYTFHVSGLTASATRTAGATIDWYDVTPALISTSSSSTAVLDASTWTAYDVSAAAPAGAVTARLSFLVTDSANAEVFYADKFGFWTGSSTTWVPPVTTPNGQSVIQFDGVDDTLSAALALPGSSTLYTVALRATTPDMALVSFRDASIPIANQIDIASDKARSVVRDNASNIALVASTASVPVGTAFVTSSVRTAGGTDTVAVGLNGTAASSSATAIGALTQTNVYLGSAYSTSVFLQGSIACVLAYSGAHDVNTRKKIVRYLGRQYAVTVAQ